MPDRETITIYRHPTRAEILKWAGSALRNAPDGSLTPEFMTDLLRDFADGLDCLEVKSAESLTPDSAAIT